jgi:hypothetical protein
MLESGKRFSMQALRCHQLLVKRLSEIQTVESADMLSIRPIVSRACAAARARREQSYVLVETLNIAGSFAACFGSHLRGTPCVAIVTDLPLAMHRMAYPRPSVGAMGSLVSNIVRSVTLRVLGGFAFLTGYINDTINRPRMPHIVIEGLVDSRHGSSKRDRAVSGGPVKVRSWSDQHHIPGQHDTGKRL